MLLKEAAEACDNIRGAAHIGATTSKTIRRTSKALLHCKID